MVKHDSFDLSTKVYNAFYKITDVVKEIVKKHSVREGIICIVTAHTTTGIAVNEGLECIESDLSDMLSKIVPEDGPYNHARFLRSYGAMAGNPTGHLKSHLTGNSCLFPISSSEIVIGKAQDIYLCEFDGPQTRTIYTTIIGE